MCLFYLKRSKNLNLPKSMSLNIGWDYLVGDFYGRYFCGRGSLAVFQKKPYFPAIILPARMTPNILCGTPKMYFIINDYLNIL